MGEMTDTRYASNSKGNTGVALGATGLGLAAANILGVFGNNCGGGLLGNLFGGNRNCGWGGAELQYVSQLQAENALLKGENYSDKIGKEVYAQSLADTRMLRTEMFANINPLIAETHAKAVADAEKIARLEEQIKCCCEKSVLQDKILDQKIDANTNLLTGKINEVALALNGKIDTNMATLQGDINTNFAKVDGRLNTDAATITGQFNTMSAQNNGKFSSLDQTISCISEHVDNNTKRIDAITEEIVPLCKVCPQPMPRFNFWQTPTAEAPSCGACSAAKTK